MFCNQCGKKVADDARFCTNCGFEINKMGTIIFAREKQFYGSLVPIKVFMDGSLVATISSGKEVSVPATVGNHKVAFDLWSGNGQYDITVPEEHPDIKVTFKLAVGAVTSKPQIVSITNV
ncbi:MAG: zinc-ribbon domain-containing protein [Clostridia bacterium]|nr:zinc-ribbon domain-containing protein [Clostridia bacterium]